jgi:Ca-activated chloride channel family protein
MNTNYMKHLLYSLLCVMGVACFAFALYHYHYLQLINAGNRAVSEKRFDTQDYERASHYWLARQDILQVNQGVLAYRAQNLPRAADFFRQVSQGSTNPTIEGQALYNLGRIFLDLKEVEQAADFFKAALRLDPQDQDAKFNLERLYHFGLLKEGSHSEAGLQQAPGAGQEKSDNPSGEGQGRNKPKSDI